MRLRNNSVNTESRSGRKQKRQWTARRALAHERRGCDGQTASECRRISIVNQGGEMSRIIITMSRTIFFRLLAYAPEELQREAKEDARRAIPALCFTEDDIREKFAQEEQWDGMSEDERQASIQSLMDVSEYDQTAKLADEAITEAVGRYLHDAMIEKEQQQEENDTA
jgi:hypothetical protein